jgi:hypothetical protein
MVYTMKCLSYPGIAGALALAAVACGESREEPETIPMTSAEESSSTGIEVDETTDEGPPLVDVGVADLPVEECAGETVMAVQKLAGARVVFVVDNSPSMYFETAEVQARLNGFAEAISDEEIDVRVLMLTAAASGYYTTNYVDQGICVAAPLGSGECNETPTPGDVAVDSLEPEFLHIDQYVNSTNALPVLVEHHDTWGPFTEGAETVHFVVVSDDDSNQPASYFIDHFLDLEPFRAAVVHAVVPTTDCPEAAQIGAEYIQLAEWTGGVVGDLCDQEFFGVFQALSNAVVNAAMLPCEYEVPVPPEGMLFDPTKVNIEFENGAGSIDQLGYVSSSFDCDFVTDGWYYDDPEMPTTIILCPQTCMDIQGQAGASVHVVLGCATVPAG